MVTQNFTDGDSVIPILVVHDKPLMSMAIARNRSDRIRVTEIASLAQAIKLLNQHPDFGLILVSMQIARFQSQSTSCIGCKFGADSQIIFLNDVVDGIGFNHIHRSHCTIASPDADGWNAIFEILFNGIAPASLSAICDTVAAPSAQEALDGPNLKKYRLAQCESRTDDAQALTPRQLQVLKLIRHGLSNRDIARHLNLSEGTVKLHNTGIFKSLGVRNRTEAALEAAKWL